MKNKITAFIKLVASWCLNIVIAICLFELFFVLVFFIKDKKYIPAEQAIKDSAPREYWVTAQPNCVRHKILSSHPYLGFTRLSQPSCANYQNEAGHTGEFLPKVKDPEYFTILLTGGSVPAQLRVSAKPQLSKLMSQYRYKGKKVRVLHGAVEAWKQPQQLILTMLSAHVVDAVVTLEGFNEITYGKVRRFNKDFSFPFLPSYKKANLTAFSDRQIGLLWLAESSYKKVLASQYLKHSKITLFALKIIRAKAIHESRKIKGNVTFERELAPFMLKASDAFKNATFEELRDNYISRYLETVKQMHSVATVSGTDFVFFLQPVPLIGKTLTEEEKLHNANRHYQNDYLLFEKKLLTLRSEGINVNSLTQVFKDTSETVYRDGIHLDLNSKGPHILNKAIVDALVKNWGLEKVN